MIDLFWDLFQQGQISDVKKDIELGREKAKYQDGQNLNLERRLRELERRHEQLKLVTLAMWSLLRDHSGLLESDLRKYVETIDLMDGKRDGKVSFAKEKVTCQGCGRVMLSTSLVCAYCGNNMSSKNPFHGA
ncbi:hypothetical protein [Gallaecimonas sp. GXIMD1310]|uniref:hypothetical protein n=1 Tax=Gallaecimonas sp. GXIMD1310 TaxID=3131926 RepID=UPI00324DB533